MRKSRLIVFVVLFLFLPACSKTIEKTDSNTEEKQLVRLDEEIIKGLEEGYLIDTPLNLNKRTTMEDIEKEWGKPVEIHDYEDIRDYVYIIQNQKITVSEDELGRVYTFQVELDNSKEEILDFMGDPTDQTGKILIYKRKDYTIVFEKIGEKWNLILRD